MVFYAQSTGTVISGREKEREKKERIKSEKGIQTYRQTEREKGEKETGRQTNREVKGRERDRETDRQGKGRERDRETDREKG